MYLDEKSKKYEEFAILLENGQTDLFFSKISEIKNPIVKKQVQNFFKNQYIQKNPEKKDNWEKLSFEEKFEQTAQDIPMAILKYGLLYITMVAILVIVLCSIGVLDEKIVFKAINDQFKKVSL